jgi:ribosome-associated toxin RatA of RatAB toxin-antitoxin module
MRSVAIVIALFWVTLSSALAADALTPAERARLAKGEPVVRVTRDAQSTSFASGSAYSVIDIATSPENVFAALTDCTRVLRVLKNIMSCKVLKRDPAGLWEVRETIVSVSDLLPNFRAVARTDYQRPARISFKQVEGNFDYLEGRWDLMAFDNGQKTRAFYRVRAGTSVPIPDFVIQGMIENDLPETLKSLRAEALRGAVPAKP